MHVGQRGLVDLVLIVCFLVFFEQTGKVKRQRDLMLETLDGIGGGEQTESQINIDRRESVQDRINRHGLMKYFWIYSDILYPVIDPYSAYITSERGPRYIDRWEYHEGIDIVSRYDYRVIAGIEGVAEVGRDRVFGEWVKVKHEQWAVKYSHLSKSYIHSGDKVKQGQIIGLIGKSGRTFGRPHLDMMLFIDGQSRNLVGNSLYRKQVEE